MKLILLIIPLLIILIQNSLASDNISYKAPKIDNHWEVTADKLLELPQSRTIASEKEDDSKELITLDEIVGKNKKKAGAYPRKMFWKYENN